MKKNKVKKLAYSATIAFLIATGSAFACSDPGDPGTGDPPGDTGPGDPGDSDPGDSPGNSQGNSPGASSSAESAGETGDVPNDYVFEYDPCDSYIEHFHGRNLFVDFVGLGSWWDEQKKCNGTWR